MPEINRLPGILSHTAFTAINLEGYCIQPVMHKIFKNTRDVKTNMSSKINLITKKFNPYGTLINENIYLTFNIYNFLETRV